MSYLRVLRYLTAFALCAGNVLLLACSLARLMPTSVCWNCDKVPVSAWLAIPAFLLLPLTIRWASNALEGAMK